MRKLPFRLRVVRWSVLVIVLAVVGGLAMDNILFFLLLGIIINTGIGMLITFDHDERAITWTKINPLSK